MRLDGRTRQKTCASLLKRIRNNCAPDRQKLSGPETASRVIDMNAPFSGHITSDS